MIKIFTSLYKKTMTVFLTFVITAIQTVSAINVEVPPSQGQEDVAITWPTRITGSESDVYDFVGVLNEYLWFTITVITFAAVLYAGFRLLTTPGGKTEWIDVTLNVVQWATIGILLSVFSYVIVRLIINLI